MEVESTVREDSTGRIIRTDRSLDITVLMGGPSAEREVSLLSGKAIAAALERLGHHVRRADITSTNVSALDADDIDLVFIALHGDFGESGQVQELCENRGVPYTGSDPRASEMAMDKAAAKQIFKHASLTTPEWAIIEEFHDPAKVAVWLEEFPPPVVIKPVDGGSSIDITIARDETGRDKAIDALLDKYSRAMIEQFVSGREMTVSILGGMALPVLEIIPDEEFYNYHAKYDDCGTRYVFDHGLDDSTVRTLQASALRAHEALNCRDMSRVDFILDDAGIAQILEINTIPGFTSHSLLPMAAKKTGISFERLVDAIAAMAMKRQVAISH